MAANLIDLLVSYIDEALDIDDLENIGDHVRSVILVEGLPDWQLNDELRLLHKELSGILNLENDRLRRIKIKAALSYFEADFSDFIIAKEIETLNSSDDR